MDRIITVTGAGVATAKPDQVRIDGTISGHRTDYASAVEASASSVAELRKIIGEAGFDMDLLKTTGFSVSASYKQVERDGARVMAFDGFSYSHGVRITVDAGVRLGSLVSISYVSSPCNVATPRMRAMSMDMGSIVPEDAEFHDSVTMEWEIL